MIYWRNIGVKTTVGDVFTRAGTRHRPYAVTDDWCENHRLQPQKKWGIRTSVLFGQNRLQFSLNISKSRHWDNISNGLPIFDSSFEARYFCKRKKIAESFLREKGKIKNLSTIEKFCLFLFQNIAR